MFKLLSTVHPFLVYLCVQVLRKQDLSLLFSGKKLVGEHTEYAFPPNLIPQYLRLLYKFDIALPLNDTELLIPARFVHVNVYR